MGGRSFLSTDAPFSIARLSGFAVEVVVVIFGRLSFGSIPVDVEEFVGFSVLTDFEVALAGGDGSADPDGGVSVASFVGSLASKLS